MSIHNTAVPNTTIALDAKTRDRLRTFGHAGLSYDEILQRMMDELDREHFVAEMHRIADAETNWVDLEDFDWGKM
jgi:hypothetical protein